MESGPCSTLSPFNAAELAQDDEAHQRDDGDVAERERPASHASRHLGAGGDTGLAFLGSPLAGEG